MLLLSMTRILSGFASLSRAAASDRAPTGPIRFSLGNSPLSVPVGGQNPSDSRRSGVPDLVACQIKIPGADLEQRDRVAQGLRVLGIHLPSSSDSFLKMRPHVHTCARMTLVGRGKGKEEEEKERKEGREA